MTGSPSIILSHPQLGENIGAAARAGFEPPRRKGAVDISAIVVCGMQKRVTTEPVSQ